MGSSASIDEVLGEEFCHDKKFFLMVNSSNVCYANSLVQCFFNSPAVVSFILEFLSALKKYPFRDVFAETPLCRLCRLYERAFEIDEPCVQASLTRVLKAVRRNTEQFPEMAQCDVHELLLFLFNSFDSTIDRVNELIGHAEIPHFTNIFRSQVVTMVQCGCGKTTTRTDDYLYIPIVVSSNSVSGSIDRFLHSGNDVCDEYICHKDLESSIVRQFSKLPNMFVIQIGRFYRTENGKFRKIMNHVPISRKIELPDEGRVVSYKLRSCIVHCGRSLYEGHYVAIYNLENRWILADDKELTAIDRDSLKAFLRSGRMSSVESPAVYLLFYEICLTQ